MTYDILAALIAFAFVSSATPGPNNLMLLASGANYGFLRSIPHMLGISIGFMFMIFMVGAGLAELFVRFPFLYTALKVVSVCYLAYLAWKIATAAPIRETGGKGRPMTFLQAAGFQWVNPKAWAMALTAVTVYSPETSLSAIALVALIFAVVNLPSVTLWTVLGQQMARVLSNGRRLRVFNWTMAGLLVASLYPLLWPA